MLRRAGLRPQIAFWVLLPVALLLAGVGLLITLGAERLMHDMVRTRNNDLAQMAAATVDHSLKRNLWLVQTVADIEARHLHDLAAQRQVLEASSDFLSRFDVGVVLLDATGKVIATDATVVNGHERRDGIVLIGRERLEVPDRAPQLQQPGAERLTVFRREATDDESFTAQAFFFGRGIPTARCEVHQHIHGLSVTVEAVVLEEAEGGGIAYVQAGPEIAGGAVADAKPPQPIGAQAASQLLQQLRGDLTTAVSGINGHQANPCRRPIFGLADAAQHGPNQPIAVPGSQLVSRVVVGFMHDTVAQQRQREPVERQGAPAQV